MATHISQAPVSTPPRLREDTKAGVAPFLAPLGRVFYALVFLIATRIHFTAEGIGYAASQGVPLPNLLVPLSGMLAIAGAIMVALGFRTRLGALMLVGFLTPVTLQMHRFWLLSDPMMRGIQEAMFLKNLSMLGAALLLVHFGPGPFSLDARRQ